MANAAHEPTLRPALRGAVDLAAVEAPRPLCPCHGEEMRRRNDRSNPWRCAVKQRGYDKRYRSTSTKHVERYQRLKAAGLCVECGQEPSVTETRCFDCVQDMNATNLFRNR